MTSIREKLDQETGQKIYLYKQGVFWTAYEQSALILSRHKPHKSNRSTDLAEQILSFRLAEKTPLEAMTFVRNLQETIRQKAAR